jgi:outer membrane PBP1 activator LpoA protein
VNRKIILLLIIATVIFVSGCGSTKNDEDQEWLRSTKSDMEMMQLDKIDMLSDQEMHLSNLDACDKFVKDAQTALQHNHLYSPTSSKFQKAQKEWDIILNDYIVAGQLRYVAVQKLNSDAISQDSSVSSAYWAAYSKSADALVDAQDHEYILYDYISDE